MVDKTAVLGLLERGGIIKTKVMRNRKKADLAGGSQEARRSWCRAVLR